MAANVDTVSAAFGQQRIDMQLCHDLMGGTPAMLRAGQSYIPIENGEDQESWQIRVNRTILFNIYKRTLRYLCGRVFEKQVSLGDDVADERFQEFTEDVDRLGHNLTIWSRHAFEAGLNDGVTFCLVDFSDVKTRKTENGVPQYQRPDGTWADKTEAADRDNRWGPYFIHVTADQILDARLQWIDGNPRITHFRYIQTLERPNGQWGTSTYQQIRAFYIGEDKRVHYEVWENKQEDGGTGSYKNVYENVLSISVIPVAWFMPGEKRGDLVAEPALIDLAYLNKRHWQATSGQYQLMEMVRRPVYFGRSLGIRDEETGKVKIIFGPGKLCVCDDPSATLQSIGVDAASVEAGRQELLDLEDRMAIYGLQLLQPKTGAITATESLQDSQENNSTLKAWALQFQDFLENCFALVGRWWGYDDGPSVVVNTDFANAIDPQVYLELYRAGVLSGETVLQLYKDMGFFDDEFVVEDEAAKIANGLMANGTGARTLTEIMQQQGL